jgi:membrane protease subunit HflC
MNSKSKLTLVIGGIIIVIFVLLLFVFQVRTTEIAVVTTFGKPTRSIDEPGANFKWPWPIQKVYRFDKRIHSFEDKFEETLTGDNFNLLVMVYVGWGVSDPDVFLQRFANGSLE